MTVNLNIKPGLEARLVTRARAAGLSLERFIEDLLERDATTSGARGSQPLSGTEKAKAFLAWANSFPPNMPVLSLKDVSR